MDIYLSKTKPILEVTQTTAVIVAQKPKVKGKIPATIEDIIAATKMRGVIAESLGADIVNVVEVDEVKLDLTTQIVPNKPVIPKRLTPKEKKRLRKQQRIHLGEIRIQKFQNFFKLNGYVPTKTKTKTNKYKTGSTELDSIFEEIDEIEEKCDEKAILIYQLEQQYFEQLERKTREENIDEEDIYWEDEQTEIEKQIEFENNPIYSGLFTR
jgi:isopropylmalate/homocitrate/citramalate synthase